MSSENELKRQREEILKINQEQEEKLRDEENLKKNKFPNDKNAPLHAPIFPCPKCKRSHRKGQACKGP